ncbi:type III restriction endonuclease subunit R [Lonepinella koalarum]|uniref:DEAD/DEAH box helicase family protein n=1 Tax=Lonepinella koalarum TaxID=53417 RepID=UPI0011E436C7|nr:DEAD/DEAH box helicase family protein [Lonepinella koalarum]TYG34555.1 type III restriction endonuclease subunit R [Lonepinella koalarum]
MAKRTFHQDLILNQWALSLFNQANLEQFKLRLGDDRFEGLNDDGQTKFFYELQSGLFYTDNISANDLRRYDLNIVKHWQKITAHRNKVEGHILQLKYFQYLSLLFTEIYLDFYFNRADELLLSLNEQLHHHLDDDKTAPDFQDYELSDLNKLAFWNATGSGKTLLMHVNILQYQHYQTHKDKLHIFVITPNESLSGQHLQEFALSEIQAKLFEKNSQIDDMHAEVQILDINKLAEKAGDVTVAVDSFSAMNKLVLVDEGHRGSSGNEWLSRRQKMIGDGFAFEYSATFGQAVKDGKTVNDVLFDMQKKQAKNAETKLKPAEIKKLPLSYQDRLDAKQKSVFETYAKCVLFDYSYKFFYGDGYGKEFQILNMQAEDYGVNDNDRKYFIACLLAFYQQLYLFQEHKQRLAVYNLEKPLWVFVGNTVNNEESDILQVVEQLAFFLENKNRTQILAWLDDLLNDEPLLLDKQGNAIFKRRFSSLYHFKGNTTALYQDILVKLFNANSSQRLYLHSLKKSDGEIALKVGNNDYFALINVGKSSDFIKNAQNLDCVSFSQDEFSNSLFGGINKADSSLNLLIGSRKFSEGWSSWRVSTMGLLNMGRGEGSQIIQLFGRGVRLKGRDFSLRRTPFNQMPKGIGLDKLETLNIFGIKADYMAKFREYLVDEGIPTPDEFQPIEIAVQKTLPAGVKLKTVKLKDGYKDNQKLGFKRTQFVPLYDIPEAFKGKIKRIRAELDLYPRLEALNHKDMKGDKQTKKPEIDERQENKLNANAFAYFDWDKLYLDLQQYKLERTWSNLQVSKQRLREFVESNQDWYKLYIPNSALEIQSFADIEKQQAILLQLLCLYTEQFYRRLKSAYEGQFMEIAEFSEDDGSFFKAYQFKISQNDDVYFDSKDVVEKINELKVLVESKKIAQIVNWRSPLNELKVICFDPHLYYPLISLEKSDLPITLSPLPINAESEQKFIHDLIQAEQSGKLSQLLQGRSLYLMRNAERKEKGVGFALAGNFYPDFLLWVVDNKTGKQYLNFVDPKGVRNMDVSDPKFGLFEEIKALEAKIGDPNLILNSFILSITKQKDWVNVHLDKDELNARHILFMEDDYLTQLFGAML